jgi:hypothetical protein
MKVVFYHTDDPTYTRYAALLEASLKKCGIDYYKETIPASDWLTAINNKAAFLLRCREKFAGDLVYIDADAFVHRDFSQDVATWDCDIAFCHYRDYITGREENLSGTVVLKDTPVVRDFLQLWKSKSEADNTRWDQATLTEAIEERPTLNVFNLEYCFTYIFDNPNCNKSTAASVVEHLQASRVAKLPKSGLKRLFKRPSKKTRRTIARTKDLEKLISNTSP